MKKYSSNKDIHQYINYLVKSGWEYHRRTKHGELWSPDKQQRIFVSISPSDKRAFMKLKSDIRKTGFSIR